MIILNISNQFVYIVYYIICRIKPIDSTKSNQTHHQSKTK